MLGVTADLRPLASLREAVGHSRAPREHHFLRAALSAHLVCAQPELPLIKRALPPRAAFDAGLVERSPGHTGNIAGREIAPGHPRCPAGRCDQPTLTQQCPGCWGSLRLLPPSRFCTLIKAGGGLAAQDGGEMGPSPRGCCSRRVQSAEGARTHPFRAPYVLINQHGLVLPAPGAGYGPCPPPLPRAELERAWRSHSPPPAQPPSPWGLFCYQPLDVEAEAGGISLWTLIFFSAVTRFISKG